ncbi:MAG TPA: Uma2 family endonuclease [Burkholderiales bacterium]|nr:Uma2 family endonuclease [Burkholderiales bacterium]
MGNVATPEFLIARWGELCRDPALEDLPYKIELNAWGKVEMSPPSVPHARHQTAVATQLGQQLADGIAMTECPILTAIGIRVPDVVWASRHFMEQCKGASPLPRAPEICVEVISRSNVQAEITEKTRAYLAAGATEVWLVAESGAIRFIDQTGEKPRSSFPVALTLPDLTSEYR